MNLDEQYLLFLNSLSSFGLIWELKYTDTENPDYNKGLITKYNLIKNLPKAYSDKLKDWDFIRLYPNILYEYNNSSEAGDIWVNKCKYR